MLINTLAWVPLLLLAAWVQSRLPTARERLWIDPVLLRMAQRWIAGNSFWMRLTQGLEWDVHGLEQRSVHQWYLVVCKHRSWVGILVLQHLLNRRIALLKFVFKSQRIWVPCMGPAWWALDFPGMRRYSASDLEQRPQARDKDAATTPAACEKCALAPTSVMDVVEGTRFTPHEHQTQASPCRHLLKPKAGGIAMALQAMGAQFGAALNSTRCHPQGTPSFLGFLQGRVKTVVVRARLRAAPQAQIMQAQDPAQAWPAVCTSWINGLWHAKDAKMQALLNAHRARQSEFAH